jgi:hypothetical protein
MQHHRAAWAYGDQLHLEPQYLWRNIVGCAVIGLWVTFVVYALTTDKILRLEDLGRSLAPMVILLLSPIVLGAAVVYVRGSYICLDRNLGQILVAKGILGMVYDWKPVAAFDTTGILRFQYCQAELQSLCVLSYLAPGSETWLMLHIYTDHAVARAAAEAIRQWEGSLSVTEVEDQAALPDARSQRPLVE